jgi:HD-GYP domain-containing protein (c-di-GMP phosphodiesterase class II)
VSEPRAAAGSEARPAVRPEARPELRSAVERMVVAVSQAVTARTLYPSAHAQTRAAIARAIAAFERLAEIQESDAAALLVAGGDLVVDHRPMPRGALFQRGLVDQLERRRIEGLTFTRGLTAEEMESFLDGMVSPAGPQSTPHLAIGRVEIAAGGTGGDLFTGVDDPLGGLEAGAPGAALSTALAAGREALAEEAAPAGKRRRPLDLRRFEAAVAPLVAALPRGALVLPDLPAADARPGADALFRHSTRVSLLALALGRALGLDGSRLQDLGVAALLHDVGKLELPRELLGKSPLDEGDHAILRTHPAVGAARLARSEGDTTLAMLVAYEHHLRWDGKPSYPALATPRRPLLASQVVAVADTYDVARAAHAEATPEASQAAALALLAERSGTWLHPALVAAFSRLVAPQGG